MTNEIILIIVGIVLFLVLFFMSFTNLQQIVRIRRTPAAYISAFPYEGQVKVSGKAGPAVARSSITQTDCTFYEVEIKERRGGRNPHYVTIYKGSSPQPFEVQDESSRIVVQPEGAALVLKNTVRDSSGVFSNLDQPILDAVENLGVKTTGTFGWKKTLRVEERRIQPGDDMFVLGQIKLVEGRRQIVSLNHGSLIIADRVEAQLLRWLYMRVAVRLVLIPLGVIAFLWLLVSIS